MVKAITEVLSSSTAARRCRRHDAARARLRAVGDAAEAARRRDGRSPSVSVVIPAFNEEESIDWVLEHIPSWVSEVVLVDGLSTDLTEAFAHVMRRDIVVVHQHERGKGAALRAGFAAARGDIIVMMDADGSTDPREMHRLVETLEAGADFVKGSRSLDEGGSVDLTLLRQAGNRGFVQLANLLYGSRFTDLCYGYCAFWRHHLDSLALTADGFEIETQLVLRAVKARLDIREVPSFELSRRGGRSNLNAFRDGRNVLKVLLRERSHRNSHDEVPWTQIQLLRLEKPALDSDRWLPAGDDRRRTERRRLDRLASGYTGPERRRAERRKPPNRTTPVYVAENGRAQGAQRSSSSLGDHRSQGLPLPDRCEEHASAYPEPSGT